MSWILGSLKGGCSHRLRAHCLEAWKYLVEDQKIHPRRIAWACRFGQRPAQESVSNAKPAIQPIPALLTLHSGPAEFGVCSAADFGVCRYVLFRAGSGRFLDSR